MQERNIIEYLRGIASAKDRKQLEYWIHASEENLKKFNEVKALYVVATFEETSSVVDTDKAYSQFIKSTHQSFLHRLQPLYKYAAVAAIVLLLVGLPILMSRETEQHSEKSIVVNNQIRSGTNKAILTLENGEKINLRKGEEISTPSASSNGEEISYNRDTSGKLAYNYLTVPRGGYFQISLSDGTRVWLNSETQLKYPVNFVNGKNRQVELVYGEAYFDVTPSTENDGSKFTVLNENQEVQVLGTKFNIKAYKDEAEVYTTLVEGKVNIITQDKSKMLKPGQQSIVDTNGSLIEIADIKIKGEIGWINGEFILQHKSLKEIMKTLSRWYDMEVTFADKDLEKVKFVGILRKEQNIVDILNIIKNFDIIKGYEIKNKQVILK